MKRMILSGIIATVITTNMFAGIVEEKTKTLDTNNSVGLSQKNVCDDAKIKAMLNPPLSQGATIIDKTESTISKDLCEVILDFQGNKEIIFANTEQNSFIAGGQMLQFDESSKIFKPLSMDKLATLEKNRIDSMLKNDKALIEKMFKIAKEETLKNDKTAVVKSKYDILVFTSKMCPFCENLNNDLLQAFPKDNVKIYKYYVPINQEDANNLRQTVYKTEDAFKEAIEIKNKLGGGVPIVLIRDTKTKEYVDYLTGFKGEKLEKLVNYIKTTK